MSIDYMLENKIIKKSDFVEIIDYKFSDEAISNNALKLKMLGITS